MKTLIAFNGDASLKKAMITQVKKHEKADALAQDIKSLMSQE